MHFVRCISSAVAGQPGSRHVATKVDAHSNVHSHSNIHDERRTSSELDNAIKSNQGSSRLIKAHQGPSRAMVARTSK